MTLNEKFRVWFCGDESAVQFAELLWSAMQEWDDIEDEDAKASNSLLSWLAFGKEFHPFFAAHAHIMRSALLQMYLQWRAANVLDRGDESDVAKSYMLRAGYYGVLHMMAYICGGDDWAAKVGPEIYREYGETPYELWKEFNPCPDQQE